MRSFLKTCFQKVAAVDQGSRGNTLGEKWLDLFGQLSLTFRIFTRTWRGTLRITKAPG